MNSFLRLGFICRGSPSNVVDRKVARPQRKNSQVHLQAQQLLEVGLLTKAEYEEIIESDVAYRQHMNNNPNLRQSIYKTVSTDPVKSEMKIEVRTSSCSAGIEAQTSPQPTVAPQHRSTAARLIQTVRMVGAYSAARLRGSSESKSDEDECEFEEDDGCGGTVRTVSRSSSSNRSRLSSLDLRPHEPSDNCDNLDPITLTPLEGVIYHFRSACGKRCVSYNISSIVRYISRTGELRDPVTRLPLTDSDLEDIDALVQASSKWRKVLPSVRAVKQHREVYEKESRNVSTIAGLEACLGEIIVDILDTVESARGTFSLQNAESKLPLLFSQFDMPFAELKTMSIEAAYHAHKRWEVFLLGPPKRPTPNMGGILTMALEMLESYWSREDQRQLMELRRSTLLKYENEPPAAPSSSSAAESCASISASASASPPMTNSHASSPSLGGDERERGAAVSADPVCGAEGDLHPPESPHEARK